MNQLNNKQKLKFDFPALAEELGINVINESIEKELLHKLLTADELKECGDNDSLYKTVAKKIQNINPDSVSPLPDFMINKLFKERPSFAREDDFALYILKIGEKKERNLRNALSRCT